MRSMVPFEIKINGRMTNVTSKRNLLHVAADRRPILCFLSVIILLNLIQSAFTDLTGDEALYWMYGQLPDWGYKDHTPVIGMMIHLGSKLLPGSIGARLLVVAALAITLYLVWLLASPVRTGPFVLLAASMPVLHIYGFIATPDVPLLLATSAYLVVWKSFLAEPGWRRALWLGFWMGALVWSKYHGLLVILFTWLPHRRLWLNGWYWMAGAIGIVLFAPHLIWQIAHDLPSVRFHLIERSGEFRWASLLEFVAGQAGLFNPLVWIMGLIVLARIRPDNDFERSLRALAWLIWFFFLAMSLRGRVEAHWTAVCAIPVIILLTRHRLKWLESRWFKWSSILFIALIAGGRLALMVDFLPPLYKSFHLPEKKLRLVHDLAGGSPVCFMNSYQDPSLYMFYFDQLAHAEQNVDGGRNQYNWWTFNEHVHKKDFLFVASYHVAGFEEIERDGVTVYVRRYSDLPVLHQLDIQPQFVKYTVKEGDTLQIPCRVVNGNTYPLNFPDPSHEISWSFLMSHKKPWQQKLTPEWLNWPGHLDAGEAANAMLRLVLQVPPGSYRCGVAARVDRLPATYQSGWIWLIVQPRETLD